MPRVYIWLDIEEDGRQMGTGFEMKKRLWSFLPKLMEYILVFMSFMIAFLVFLMVIFRYILKINLYGMEELLIMIAWWLYFIGGSYGSYERSHIAVDAIDEFVSNEKIMGFLKVFRSISTSLLSIVLAYYSISFVSWGIKENVRTVVNHWPLAYSQFAILVGFFLMTFYSIVYAFMDTKELVEIYKSNRRNRLDASKMDEASDGGES